MASGDSPEQKAAKWDVIRAAWVAYREKGASTFDWDYDSRDLMDALLDGSADEGASALAEILAGNDPD